MPYPTPDDKENFFKGLQEIYPQSAILSAVFLKPQVRTLQQHPIKTLPKTLNALQKDEYQKLSHSELLKECERVFKNEIVVTKEEAHYLERSTTLQSKSSLWFEHRKGRITASKFGQVCHTSITSPSKSLIQSILQQGPVVKSEALEWGIRNESTARAEYYQIVHKKHQLFEIDDAGLFVLPSLPHLGASPDGLVRCQCCGDGIIEIKCPFSIRDTTPEGATKKYFYLKHTKDGLQLSRTHHYYYQIQGQLLISERWYCDFICWTPHGIHIERIERDITFIDQMVPKLSTFFTNVLLPRILQGGNTFSVANSETLRSEEDVSNNQDQQEYCFCRKGEYGEMIACDNPQCPYEWFHFDCVKLTSTPEGEWYCPSCK